MERICDSKNNMKGNQSITEESIGKRKRKRFDFKTDLILYIYSCNKWCYENNGESFTR